MLPRISLFSFSSVGSVIVSTIALFLIVFAPFSASAQVDLNSASESELATLPGIGRSTAQKIVEDRELRGPFGSVGDLARVPGVGARTVEALTGLAVAGLAGRADLESKRSGASAGEVENLLARYLHEPSVQQVQEKAMRYAEIHPERMRSWRRRASSSAVLPQMRVTYRRNVEEDTRLIEQPGNPDRWQWDWDDDHQVTMVARWDLDELIFNSDELRVSSENVRLVRLREGVLNQVTKLYFERRRLQVERDLSPTGDVGVDLRREMRLHELTAQIDALTGGWFSKELEKTAPRR